MLTCADATFSENKVPFCTFGAKQLVPGAVHSKVAAVVTLTEKNHQAQGEKNTQDLTSVPPNPSMLKRYLMQKFIHLLFIFIFMQHTTYFQAVIKMHLVDPAAYCCISLSPVSMVVLLCQVCMFESFS